MNIDLDSILINLDSMLEVSTCIDILTKELDDTLEKAYENWSVRDHRLVEMLCILESRKEELSLCGIR